MSDANVTSQIEFSEKLVSVMSYLRAEFPACEIIRAGENETEIVLQLVSSNHRHVIRVQRSFVEDTPTDEIIARLLSFRLSSVLRDLGDLPVFLTTNGCIFM